MGGIRKVISSINSSDELGKTQKEALDILSQLASAKADTFDYQIKESLQTAGTATNATVPISSIISSTKEIRAFSSSELSNITGEVNSALKSFSSKTPDSIINGVGTLIGTALGKLLGESHGETGIFEDYYVMTEKNSIIRIDVKAWYQNIISESLKTKVEKVTAVTAVKSIVNLLKIDFSTFYYFYQDQLGKTELGDADIAKALEDASSIYKKFKEVNSSVSMKPMALRIPPASNIP